MLAYTFGPRNDETCRELLALLTPLCIGMVAAMRLSALLGNEDLTAPLIDLLKHIGLPTELNYDREAIFNALLSDKKKFGATVNFILVREAGRAEITPIDAEKLHEYVLKL